jgi:hypothetical protein
VAAPALAGARTRPRAPGSGTPSQWPSLAAGRSVFRSSPSVSRVASKRIRPGFAGSSLRPGSGADLRTVGDVAVAGRGPMLWRPRAVVLRSDWRASPLGGGGRVRGGFFPLGGILGRKRRPGHVAPPVPFAYTSKLATRRRALPHCVLMERGMPWRQKHLPVRHVVPLAVATPWRC